VGLADPVVGPAAGEGAADPADVPTDRGLAVGGTQVYLGSFDESALADAVDAGAFTESDTTGIYAHDDNEMAVAWGSDAVIVAPTPDQVDVLDKTGAGEIDRRHEVDDDYEWILQTGGGGDFSVLRLAQGETVQLSGQGDLTDFSAFEGSRGFAQSATLDGDSGSATTAAVYPDEGAVDRERLESGLGTGAADRSVEQDGRYVTVTAAFDQIPSDGGDTGTPAAGGSTDTPAEETEMGSGETEMSGDDGGSGNDGGPTTEEADSPGLGILAALASLGAVGYRAARRRDGER
jgi:PGF-CTERM protein